MDAEEKKYASSLTELPRPCPKCDHKEGYFVFTEPDYGGMWACAKCGHEFPGSDLFTPFPPWGGVPLTVQPQGSGMDLTDAAVKTWWAGQTIVNCPKCGHTFNPNNPIPINGLLG